MHIPLRMCIACREHRPAPELLRLAVDKNTQRVKVQEKRHIDGRGVYICRNAECLQKAEKKRLIERQLRSEKCDALYRQLEDII